jgi:hypothetical protein
MQHALAVLAWHELPEEDIPPQHLWLDDEAINEHFEKVRDRRASGSGPADLESVPQPDLEQNELTAQYRKK